MQLQSGLYQLVVCLRNEVSIMKLLFLSTLVIIAAAENEKNLGKRSLDDDFGFGFDTDLGFESSLDNFAHGGKIGFHDHATITRTVPVPHPVPVHVPVDRPYPVPVPKPYPVHIPKPYPVPVDRPVLIKIPVVRKVPVPVPKPYPVVVSKPYPVIVEKPVFIKSHDHGWSGGHGWKAGKHGW